MNEKIRIGILVNSLDLELWKHQIIDEINASHYAQVVLIIQRKEVNTSNIYKKIWRFRNSIIYKALEAIDVFLSKKIIKKHPNAFIKRRFNNSIIDVLDTYPKTSKFKDIIVDDDINRMKAYSLDLIIRFGFRILDGKILNEASKYGVWSYHHGDNKVNRGGPPGFWEVIQGWKETGCTLQKLSNDLDGGYVLAKTWVGTYKYNILENKNRLYWRASKIIPRILEELHTKGYEVFTTSKKDVNVTNNFYTKKLYKAPSNFEAIIVFLKYTKIIIKQILSVAIFNDQWFLLYKRTKSNPETSFRKMIPLIPNKNLFWADPFLVSKNNIDYIFIEEYDFKIKKGHISVIKMVNNKIEHVKKVLDNTYHFSYPFVFEYKKEYYMIPETAANNSVELYKCIDFPYSWSFQKNIFENIKAVDTTLFQYNNTWWLFTAMDETRKATKNDELFLYYSEDPISQKWTPHPMNPIISDAKFARPAGNLFIKDNEIYRPSQNCTGVYGSSININHVAILNETNYKEQCLESLTPDWDSRIKGIHTINFNEYATVIDCFKKKLKIF